MNKETNISIIEFLDKRFPNEKTSEAFFVKKRWGGQITCPYCFSDTIYKVKGKQPYKCPKCNKKFTAKTGTIMEGSHISIRMWLLAMYLMGTSRKGISSIELANQLHVTQKTAWYMAHRIRGACTEKNKLRGVVEVDETYIGGKEKNRHAKNRFNSGRGTANKIPVVGLHERGGKTIGRVVEGTSAYELISLIKKNVVYNSSVFTDKNPSYDKVTIRGYQHQSVNHSCGEYVDGLVHTNSIESVWALLKRGLYGTYHHVSKKHLTRYVNEFCFRLSNGGTLPFIEAVCLQAKNAKIKYKELTK